MFQVMFAKFSSFFIQGIFQSSSFKGPSLSKNTHMFFDILYNLVVLKFSV